MLSSFIEGLLRNISWRNVFSHVCHVSSCHDIPWHGLFGQTMSIVNPNRTQQIYATETESYSRIVSYSYSYSNSYPTRIQLVFNSTIYSVIHSRIVTLFHSRITTIFSSRIETFCYVYCHALFRVMHQIALVKLFQKEFFTQWSIRKSTRIAILSPHVRSPCMVPM